MKNKILNVRIFFYIVAFACVMITNIVVMSDNSGDFNFSKISLNLNAMLANACSRSENCSATKHGYASSPQSCTLTNSESIIVFGMPVCVVTTTSPGSKDECTPDSNNCCNPYACK